MLVILGLYTAGLVNHVYTVAPVGGGLYSQSKNQIDYYQVNALHVFMYLVFSFIIFLVR